MDHHPYFPPDLVISNYVPNQLPRSRLLMIVGSLATLIVSISFLSAKGRKLSTSESLRFSWFVVCVPLHCGFEAYWLWYSETIASRSDLLSELWKEYAHGDSRYLSVDPVLYALETITAFVWGPLCLLSACAIWQRSPSQFLWQLMASLGHLFSCGLYFVLDWPTGFQNCNPHPVYFWVYFVAFNSPWFVVPVVLSGQSISKIAQALKTAYVKIKSS